MQKNYNKSGDTCSNYSDKWPLYIFFSIPELNSNREVDDPTYF